MLLNDVYISFLSEKVEIFKKLRANKVYVHVRVVLTRFGLSGESALRARGRDRLQLERGEKRIFVQL